MTYLDRKQRTDGDYHHSLAKWEEEVRKRYPQARFEVEDHGAFKRNFAHNGDDPTGLHQIGHFNHNTLEDHGHGFIKHL